MKKLINESVSRFLGWKLPADFAPDAGITFKPNANTDSPVQFQYKHEPTGTNLLNGDQAEAMLLYVTKPLLDELNHWKSQATSLATAVMMDETANDSNPCVSLQITDDGVWAHFRVGNGFAYSQNLSADEMSKKFADEYIKHRSEVK